MNVPFDLTPWYWALRLTELENEELRRLLDEKLAKLNADSNACQRATD